MADHETGENVRDSESFGQWLGRNRSWLRTPGIAMPKRFSLGGLVLTLPAGWCNLSRVGDDCFTLADPVAGIGALQVSVVRHRSGPQPDLSRESVSRLHHEFCGAAGLGEGFDSREEAVGGRVLVATSHRWGTDFVRVWDLVAGRVLARATYTCDWEVCSAEVSDCEHALLEARLQRRSTTGAGS